MLVTQPQHTKRNTPPLSTRVSERRNEKKIPSLNSLWDQLNLSQQYAVCSLGQFGYMLNHVRTFGEATLAILTLDNKVATINEAGTININPSIVCRV